MRTVDRTTEYAKIINYANVQSLSAEHILATHKKKTHTQNYATLYVWSAVKKIPLINIKLHPCHKPFLL